MKAKRRRIRLRRPSRKTMGAVAALAAAATLQVWLQLQTTELGYEIALLRQARQRLAGEQADLEAELASLTSPRALDAVARQKLGLRAPEQGQVVGLP